MGASQTTEYTDYGEIALYTWTRLKFTALRQFAEGRRSPVGHRDCGISSSLTEPCEWDSYFHYAQGFGVSSGIHLIFFGACERKIKAEW